MRFQGIASDANYDLPNGGRWRPPDHMSSPIQLLQGSSGRSGKEADQKCEESKRIARGEQKAKRKRRGYLKSSARQRVPRRPEWIRKIVGEGLPIPSTQSPAAQRRHPLTYCQRLFAISIAILVVMSVLGTLITLLSEQLESVASKVEAQNEMIQNSEHSHSEGGERHSGNGLRRRKLTMVAPTTDTTQNRQIHHGRYIRSFFSNMYQSFVAVERILNALYRSQRSPFTTYLLHQPGHTPIRVPSQYSIRAAASFPTAAANLNSIQRELQAIYQDLLMGKVNAPLQLPRTEAVNSASSLLDPTGISKEKNQRTSSSPTYSSLGAFLIPTEDTKGPQNTIKARNVLHSNALNVVGDIDIAAESASPENDRTSRRFNNTQEEHNPRVPKGFPMKDEAFLLSNRTSTNPGRNFLVNGRSLPDPGSFPDAIEVWNLPNGKSLCRIFGAGRLMDGTLILPKWMKGQSEFLLTSCGIRGAIYAIETLLTPRRKTGTVDKSILRATIKSDFEEDHTYSDRDLFGLTAPRNHMPHFVSDIFLPLVASEVLLGSGKGVLRSSVISSMTRLRITEPSFSMFPDLKPALLIYDETLNRPRSEWVPRLARFFEHPQLGFKMIPAGAEKRSTQASGRRARLSFFRSLVTSNLNIHEPYGLFGTQGKNIVFEVNGITREPPWTMKGMLQNPCIVHVTVLTRKGPRALLKLKDLQKKAEHLGTTQRIRTDFKVVDFAEIPFDDQVSIMQNTNVLVATHGAGNANFIFLRPQTAVIEVFPFSYKAGPFDSFARIFGLYYSPAMSAPQSGVFKECMNRHEKNTRIRNLAFARWDKAVDQEKKEPWVHRLEFEKEFGEPGKSQGMTTRGCVRLQELEFSIEAVARMVVESGRAQCSAGKYT